MQGQTRTSKKERNSNFELCRLACMFYIVIYHLFIHNGDVTGGAYYEKALTTIFSIGVPVFVLISGYFKINASIKGFLNIVYQVFFYSIIADILCKYVFHETLSTNNILGTFFPVSRTQYWFVGTYLLLYIISPFLNRFLDTITQKEYVVYIVTISLLVCYVGGVMNVHGANYGDRSILTFIYLYSLGQFVRRYYNDIHLLPVALRKPWLTYTIVICIFFVLVTTLPLFLSRGINSLAHSYNSIGLTFFSVLFFFCFLSLKIQKSWINYLAKSTFAIYLIHGNNIVTYHRWIYNPYTEWGVRISNIHMRLIYLLVFAIVICIACVIIDQIRLFLFRYTGIKWIINKADELIGNKVLTILKYY